MIFFRDAANYLIHQEDYLGALYQLLVPIKREFSIFYISFKLSKSTKRTTLTDLIRGLLTLFLLKMTQKMPSCKGHTSKHWTYKLKNSEILESLWIAFLYIAFLGISASLYKIFTTWQAIPIIIQNREFHNIKWSCEFCLICTIFPSIFSPLCSTNIYG